MEPPNPDADTMGLPAGARNGHSRFDTALHRGQRGFMKGASRPSATVGSGHERCPEIVPETALSQAGTGTSASLLQPPKTLGCDCGEAREPTRPSPSRRVRPGITRAGVPSGGASETRQTPSDRDGAARTQSRSCRVPYATSDSRALNPRDAYPGRIPTKKVKPRASLP
jgi:hypothetical protein